MSNVSVMFCIIKTVAPNMAQPFIIVIALVFLALVTLPIEGEGRGEGLFISLSPCIFCLGSHVRSIQECPCG